jgi:hypothetical protein
MTFEVFINKWHGHEFQSSMGLTEEFASFAKDLKKAVTQAFQGTFVVMVHRGHFEVSGFLQNKATDRWVYWHVSDVRFFQDEWVNHVLVRTATSDHDFAGGPNQYTTLMDLPAMVQRLSCE